MWTLFEPEKYSAWSLVIESDKLYSFLWWQRQITSGNVLLWQNKSRTLANLRHSSVYFSLKNSLWSRSGSYKITESTQPSVVLKSLWCCFWNERQRNFVYPQACMLLLSIIDVLLVDLFWKSLFIRQTSWCRSCAISPTQFNSSRCVRFSFCLCLFLALSLPLLSGLNLLRKTLAIRVGMVGGPFHPHLDLQFVRRLSQFLSTRIYARTIHPNIRRCKLVTRTSTCSARRTCRRWETKSQNITDHSFCNSLAHQRKVETRGKCACNACMKLLFVVEILFVFRDCKPNWNRDANVCVCFFEVTLRVLQDSGTSEGQLHRLKGQNGVAAVLKDMSEGEAFVWSDHTASEGWNLTSESGLLATASWFRLSIQHQSHEKIKLMNNKICQTCTQQLFCYSTHKSLWMEQANNERLRREANSQVCASFHPPVGG